MIMNSRFQSPFNFLGLPEELCSAEKSRGWVLPVPYESTTSYGAGTREGPAAILAASRQVEWYDQEYSREAVTEYGIYTTPPLSPVHQSPEAMVQVLEATVAELFTGVPRPETLAVLGGEHTLSAGIVRGLAKVIPPDKLVAVQVDAHADLRQEYEGSPFSHACAARRILDICPLFQIGIRNLSLGEAELLPRNRRIRTIFSPESNTVGGTFLKELARFVRGKQVFFTIDLDGLDPSIMPSVGTPEPDGISWPGILEIARTVCRHAQHIPIFDIMELAPIPGFRAPDFLAAKLIYKLFSYILCNTKTGNTSRKRGQHGKN